MFSFLLSFAMAACPAKFGIQQPNGSWSFYPEKIAGSVEVEVDSETCEPIYQALKKEGSKFVLDKTLVAAAKAERAKEKADEETNKTALDQKLSRMDLLRKNQKRTQEETNELVDIQNDILTTLFNKMKR